MSEVELRGRKLILALASVGAGLCLLLEYMHYRAYAVPSATSFCSLGETVDCTSVALSTYGVLLGIPMPLWGFAGFLAIGLAGWQRSRWLLPLAGFAALASLGLIAVSAFDLKTFCLLCEAVHLVSFALFALAWRARRAELVPLGERDTALLVLGPSLGILFAVSLFLPPYWGAFGWKGEVPFARGNTSDGDAWIGAESPKLTIEEFVDYSCPHCKAATATNLRRLARHTDELRIVRRHFPATPCLPRIEGRCLAVRIALCADAQGKFWQADRWLFEHATQKRALEPAEAARDLSLDQAALDVCLEREETSKRAQEMWQNGKKLKIPGTPYYRVEDKLMTHADAVRRLDEL